MVQACAGAWHCRDPDKWAEARGESVFSSKQLLESRMEEQRKRLRLDETYQRIPSAAPALTAEQVAQIAERHKQSKKQREDEPRTRRLPP